MHKQLYYSETGSVNLLARLTIGESYSSITLSEYTCQLISSVETIGAVLVANGVCTLINTTIAANISIQTNQSESYSLYGRYVPLCFHDYHISNTDIDIIMSSQSNMDSILVNLTKVTRQILMLPIMTEAMDYTSNPPAAKFNMTGLVTGLIAAIVVVLFLLIILAAVMVIFCKFHQTRK